MRRRRRPYRGRVIKKNPNRINGEITASEVRLVGENVEDGIYSTSRALKMADEQDLDLVEITAKSNPPVCKILDYKKFLYDKRKKDKEIKSKTVKTVIKEIRFTPNTDDHDFDFKAKHAEKFLKEGAKVKAWVNFRGRAILFKERGELLLLKFADKLAEHSTLEQMPKLEGRRMFIFLAPKKTK